MIDGSGSALAQIAGRELKRNRPAGGAAIRAALVIGLALGLTGCKIVKNGTPEPAGANGDAASSAGFDPKTFVDASWDSKLIPLFDKQAVPAADVLAALPGGVDAAGQRFGHRAKQEGTPWHFIVKGEGTIVAASTESRAATVTVDLAPGDGKGDLVIQIGPVLRGTAVRDAADFISFDQVTNQIQFAQLSRSINDRVRDQVLKDFPREGLVGRKITFEGTFPAPNGGELPLVTPVSVKLER